MRSFCAASLFVLLIAGPVAAQDGSPFSVTAPAPSGSYTTPRPSNLVPRSIFDPSRLSISNSMTFGYSSGGYGFSNGSAGLFTSSLGYRIAGNAAMRVDVGAHVNPAFGGGGTEHGIFLQGAALDWRPTRNSLLRFEYRDMRSPLQQGYGYGYGGLNGFANGYDSGAGWGAPYGTNLGQETPAGSGVPGTLLRN